MDESLQELENELKALQPRRPSVLLRAKIEHDLGPATHAPAPAAATPAARPRYSSATTLRSWKWAGWRMAAGIAAVLAVSFVFWNSERRPADPPSEIANRSEPQQNETVEPGSSLDPHGSALANAANVYRPVKAANVLYDLQDEGAVMLDNDVAARRVRARYVDTYTFKNPATNASLKWSVPRDEVRVLPASFH